MHIFFDLDGTLTDPRKGIVACFKHAFTALGIELPKNIKLESHIGPPINDVFRELCGADLAEEAIVRYRERFSTKGLYENRLHDGILDCLNGLVDQVDAIYVVTSKPTVYSEQIIEHFEIQRFFKAIYGSNLDGSLADKAELIKHVIETESIRAEDAIMIGDRKFDILGAKANGVSTIGALWGFGTEQELREPGADRICVRPTDLCGEILTHQNISA